MSLAIRVNDQIDNSKLRKQAVRAFGKSFDACVSAWTCSELAIPSTDLNGAPVGGALFSGLQHSSIANMQGYRTRTRYFIQRCGSVELRAQNF